MRTLGIAVLSCLMAASAFAQVVRTDETFQVNLVEVPVTVMDSKGEPIRGLTKENFEVYDQNQKREITNFDMIDFAMRAKEPASAAIASGMGAARRNFMLLFDLGNSNPTSLIRARTAALKFVDEQLLAGDRAAVGTMSPQKGFQLHATFSTDRKLVREAINTLGLSQFQMAGDPLLITMSDLGAGRTGGQSASGGSVSETAKEGAVIENLQDITLGSQKATDEAQRRYVIKQVADFESMGRILDRISGRKEVILLSEGFDPRMLQGRTTPSAEATPTESATETGEIWKVDNDARYGSTEAKSGLQRMVDSLRRSDVVLNAVDIKGLRGSIDAREGITSKSNDALHLLTRDTGGQVFRNANDLGQELGRLLKSHEVTYVLGFSGGASKAPGKFHNLKVKVVNVQGAKLSHRPGYYEPSPVTSEFDRFLTAGEIVTNSMPIDAVKIAVMATAFPRKDGPADVPVIIQVAGKSLLDNAKGASAQPEFFMYAYDSQELIRDFAYQRVALDLNKVRDRLSGRGIKFYGTLTLPPGDYTIRTLVRDGLNNGFSSVPLHVPAFGEASASMALHDTGEWLMVKGQDRTQGRPYPFQVGDKAIIPSVSPVLAAGTYDVALLTYNIPADNLNVTGRIETSAGTPQAAPLSLVGRTEKDAAGGVKLLFTFTPPAQLARGDYSLVFNLRDIDGANEKRVTLPFHVN